MRSLARALLLAGIVLTAACDGDDPVVPNRPLARFQLDDQGDPLPFALVSSHESGNIIQGVPVAVRIPIVTGTCTTPGGRNVAMSNNMVTITLFADTGCDGTDVAVVTTRAVNVTFPLVGDGLVKVTALGADGTETVQQAVQVQIPPAQP